MQDAGMDRASCVCARMHAGTGHMQPTAPPNRSPLQCGQPSPNYFACSATNHPGPLPPVYAAAILTALGDKLERQKQCPPHPHIGPLYPKPLKHKGAHTLLPGLPGVLQPQAEPSGSGSSTQNNNQYRRACPKRNKVTY